LLHIQLSISGVRVDPGFTALDRWAAHDHDDYQLVSWFGPGCCRRLGWKQISSDPGPGAGCPGAVRHSLLYSGDYSNLPVCIQLADFSAVWCLLVEQHANLLT